MAGKMLRLGVLQFFSCCNAASLVQATAEQQPARKLKDGS
jgi:hypothetical protein